MGGARSPDQVAWIDAPPQAHWQQAVDLLQWLDLLDADGAITDHGKSARDLGGLHPPRLAHMVVRGGRALGGLASSPRNWRHYWKSVTCWGGPAPAPICTNGFGLFGGENGHPPMAWIRPGCRRCGRRRNGCAGNLRLGTCPPQRGGGAGAGSGLSGPHCPSPFGRGTALPAQQWQGGGEPAGT